ncbi:hypothetical protein [Sorangium sp. So ce145]|uniref:hypothetical protein n=1 Tax=Sorangium sp. So ce145 TaxID=3133285 RepID=UPI003F5FDFA0
MFRRRCAAAALVAMLGSGCGGAPAAPAGSPAAPTATSEARAAPAPPGEAAEPFARVHNKLSTWPGLRDPRFDDVRASLQRGEAPISPVLLLVSGVEESGCPALGGQPRPDERPTRQRYLYVALVGWQVVVAYLDERFEILSMAHHAGSQGFSVAPMAPREPEGDTCVVLVAHEHAGTGLDRDAILRVNLAGDRVQLQPIALRPRGSPPRPEQP